MCGGVRYLATAPLRDVFNCHCKRCQQFTGHHMAATAVSPDRLALTHDSTLTWFEASPGVFYGFCATCGSSLFWRADAHPEKISLCAGTLDSHDGLSTTCAWWVADAAPYHQRPAVTEYQFE